MVIVWPVISFKLIDGSRKTVQYQWNMVNYEASLLWPPRCLSVKPFHPLQRLISLPINVFFSCPLRRCVCVCVSVRQQNSFVRGLFTRLRSHVVSRGAAGPFYSLLNERQHGTQPLMKKRKTPRGNPAKMMNSGARGELIHIWGEALPSDGREETGPPVWADVTPAGGETPLGAEMAWRLSGQEMPDKFQFG